MMEMRFVMNRQDQRSIRVIVVDLDAEFPAWVAISGLANTSDHSFNLMECTNTNGLIEMREGHTLNSLLEELKESHKKGIKIALGFEAPMWWIFERGPRFSGEEGARQWYLGIAAQATALAYIHGYPTLKYLKDELDLTFTFDQHEFHSQKDAVLLFEAFATGTFKPYHAQYKGGEKIICWNGYELFEKQLNLTLLDNPKHTKKIRDKNEKLKKDKIDAMICAVSFYAHHYKINDHNTFYWDQINQTVAYKSALNTVRVCLNGDECWGDGETITKEKEITSPILNQWEVILNAISNYNESLSLNQRCEIYGIKFY